MYIQTTHLQIYIYSYIQSLYGILETDSDVTRVAENGRYFTQITIWIHTSCHSGASMLTITLPRLTTASPYQRLPVYVLLAWEVNADYYNIIINGQPLEWYQFLHNQNNVQNGEQCVCGEVGEKVKLNSTTVRIVKATHVHTQSLLDCVPGHPTGEGGVTC